MDYKVEKKKKETTININFNTLEFFFLLFEIFLDYCWYGTEL